MRRFVLLEHRWEGVHFDFMVEIEPGGALRTWAIELEPVEGVTLASRALADHRREYLTYEGPVSGGRGSVCRRDDGECRVVEWSDDRVRLILDGRQLVGPVEILRSEGIESASGAGGGSIWSFRLGKFS